MSLLFTLPFNKTFPAFGQQPSASEKTLVALDIDNTLIPWHQKYAGLNTTIFRRYEDTLQKASANNDVLLMLNTGRGPKAFGAIAPILSGLPIDLISLNDLQRLYFGPHLQNTNGGETKPLRKTQWFQTIGREPHPSLSKIWQKELGGWNDLTVQALVIAFLEKQGYQRTESKIDTQYKYLVHEFEKKEQGIQYKIGLIRDQLYFRFYYEDKQQPNSFYVDEAKKLTEKLIPYLKETYPTITCQIRPRQNLSLIHYQPRAISKADTIEFAVGQLKPLQFKQVITAGDGKNDIEMLSRKNFHGVPNKPIQIGHRLDNHFSETSHPRLVQVETGELDKGLKQQLIESRMSKGNHSSKTVAVA